MSDPKENIEELIAYGLDNKMRTYQFHYTSIKTRYKKQAVIWLLATFIGYSYILSNSSNLLHINRYLIFLAISLLSTFGLSLLYFIDIAIYQQLSESIFYESESLENKFSILGKTNKNIAKLLVEGKIYPLVYETLVYSGFTFVTLLVADVSLFFYLKPFSSLWSIISLCVFFGLILFYETYIIFGGNFLLMSKKMKDKLKKNTKD